MSKKILFVANTMRHLYLCHLPYFKYFKDHKYEVHTASDNDALLNNVDKSYKLSIKRNPYSFHNINAVFELKKILLRENYDIIHVHTPMGSVVARIAAKLAGLRDTKIVYTAHGFHFFRGCPKINYLLYYPIEKWLSRSTDLIITINEEDYNFARKHFKTDIRYVPGVGFNDKKFNSCLNAREKKKFRDFIGLNMNDYVISYVAEMCKRKRHENLLKLISKMNITNEKFLFIGDGSRTKKIKKLINKYNLNNIVKIIDFNDNISNYLDISDLIISVSQQEGLPLNIMEAMYKEKPIVVTDCRGNRDLIKNEINGLVVELNNKEEFIMAIERLKNDSNYAIKLGSKNKNIVNKYSITAIMIKMDKIYRELMEK